MFNNFNVQDVNINQPTIEINTENQNQEVRVETDEEILEQAKNCIIEIRKRDKDKIKIEGDVIIDPQTGTWIDTKKYYNPTKDMFDSSFYAFLDLTKKINGFFSYDVINKQINNLIKILKEDYSEFKKEYSSYVDYDMQKRMLSRAEALYMLTYYIHRKLMNKNNTNGKKLPLILISFIREILNEGKKLEMIVDANFTYCGPGFFPKFKGEDFAKLEILFQEMSICIEKANYAAHNNYFETE